MGSPSEEGKTENEVETAPLICSGAKLKTEGAAQSYSLRCFLLETLQKCEDLRLTEIKTGTLSSDAECVNSPAALIAGIIVAVLIVAVAVAVTIFLKTCASQSPGGDQIFLSEEPVKPTRVTPMLKKQDVQCAAYSPAKNRRIPYNGKDY
ncbi:hypothetical protein SRHO_G00324240 [Serrasalmus rhombeus]